MPSFAEDARVGWFGSPQASSKAVTANYEPYVNNNDDNNNIDNNSDDHDDDNKNIEYNNAIIRTPLDCGDGGESRRLALIARTHGAFGSPPREREARSMCALRIAAVVARVMEIHGL